jgi:hypothetical protein
MAAAAFALIFQVKFHCAFKFLLFQFCAGLESAIFFARSMLATNLQITQAGVKEQ